MRIDFPYHIDERRRTAQTSENDHIRDLVEQVLFTSPGERVNRPTFGSGLLQLLFEPASDELSATLSFLVQSSLQVWLGEIIEVEEVGVETEDSTLRVLVAYTVRRDQQRQTAQFTREL